MSKALLVVSFGANYLLSNNNSNMDLCEKDLLKVCPDRTVFHAFTSTDIICNLKERNIHVDTVLEALRGIHLSGYTDVVIQSLHIINGSEFEKIVLAVQSYYYLFERITIGLPLLSSMQDYYDVSDAVKYRIPVCSREESLIYLGHGSKHHSFSAYACLDHLFAASKFNAHVCTINGYPEIDVVINKLVEKKIKHVYIIPFMLFVGNSIIAKIPSWKWKFTDAGIRTSPLLEGLGENPYIRKVFVEHMKQAIEQENTFNKTRILSNDNNGDKENDWW